MLTSVVKVITYNNTVNRARIAEIEKLIRPHVRRTPVIEAEGVTLKLELLQHSGSFKARGAFANLLTREVPPAGVVVEFDEVERRAVRALADVGLVPPLRHRGGAGDGSGQGRQTG